MCENYKKEVPMRSVGKLQCMSFLIPKHQRGYRWRDTNVEALLNDLDEFLSEENKFTTYCMQPLAVTRKEEGGPWIIEDGQQRLTTIFLLYKYLTKGKNIYNFIFESDTENKRKNFIEGAIPEVNKDIEDVNLYHMAWAYQTISKWFETRESKIKDFVNLLTNDQQGKAIRFIWYEVPYEQANLVFRNLNNGKIRLTGADLIKALLLAESGNGKELCSDERARVAQQIEDMEQRLQNDRFWYMMQARMSDGYSDRMDFIYNLAESVKPREHQAYQYAAFEKFNDAKKEGHLLEEWNKVRSVFSILEDFYSNTYYYHYIGFLINRTKGYSIERWIDKYKTTPKDRFVEELRNTIADILFPEGDYHDLSTVDYDDRDRMRSVLLLHNIETTLSYYNALKKKVNEQAPYEKFPFDLLHKQKWDIEHMASQTDNTLDKKEEWDEWVKTTRNDFSSFFEVEKNDKGEVICSEAYILLQSYNNNPNRDTFKKLYGCVIKLIEDELQKRGNSSVKDKDKVGNMVLLDSHTNRSYKNALFPKKRRTIIETFDSDNQDKVAYVPVATRLAFMKHYSKESKIVTFEWTQKDAEAYTTDIEKKLKFYLDKNKK